MGVLAAAILIVGLADVAGTLQRATHTDGAKAVAAMAPDVGNPTTLAPPGESGSLPAIGSVAQIDHSITAWTANVAANPDDFISATNLAILYHARGRLTGDLDDQTRALAAARIASSIAPTQTTAKSLEATILYTLHDFINAVVIADALYRANPADLGSLATRADAELELGQIAAARVDYGNVAGTAPGAAVDVRLARLAYVTGHPAQAQALATKALREAADADSEADLGFYDYAVGEYARLSGSAAEARSAYAAALAIRPTDFGSLVGLAKVDAATGHVDAAIAGLEHAASIAPQPETLTLLGDLQSLQGQEADALAQYATVRAIRQLSAISGTVFDRQLLLFELDHGGASPAILAAAQAGLSTRTDAGAHDLVAWAAYRLGRLDLAQREMDAALATGIVDARILEHAGAIAIANGDRSHGEELLKQAVALGPALDPLATAEANRLLEAQ
jgi:tetratricopeptide (TPR) repeat protein